MFTRTGGRTPSRFLTGIRLQVRVDQYAHQIKDWTWGVIQVRDGEFIMPDVPCDGFVPLTTQVVFAAKTLADREHEQTKVEQEIHGARLEGQDLPKNEKETLKSNLKEINTSFLAYTWRYFLARNIATAMAGISGRDILKAIEVRDARIASGEVFQGPIAAAADVLRPAHAD
jgi:hypothetical protein